MGSHKQELERVLVDNVRRGRSCGRRRRKKRSRQRLTRGAVRALSGDKFVVEQRSELFGGDVASVRREAVWQSARVEFRCRRALAVAPPPWVVVGGVIVGPVGLRRGLDGRVRVSSG